MKVKCVNKQCQENKIVGLSFSIPKGIRDRARKLPKEYTHPAIWKLGLETAEKIIAFKK